MKPDPTSALHPTPARLGMFVPTMRLRHFALTLMLVCGLALLLTGVSSRAAGFKVGDSLPDLSTFGLEGTLPSMQGKVVLLDFFASWCGPCKESFPVMQELHQKYGSQGVVVLAINLDEKQADMADFLKKHPVTFPVVRDASNKLVEVAKIKTMPSSFVIDKQGKIHALHKGFKGEESRKKYIEEIEALLK